MPDISKFGRWEAWPHDHHFVPHGTPRKSMNYLAVVNRGGWWVYPPTRSRDYFAQGTTTSIDDAKAQAEAAMLAPGGPLHEAVEPVRWAVHNCEDCLLYRENKLGAWCRMDDGPDLTGYDQANTTRHPNCPLNTKPVLVTAGETT